MNENGPNCDGVVTDIEVAWAVEIDRRIAEVESGEIETLSWEEARTRIKARLASCDQELT